MSDFMRCKRPDVSIQSPDRILGVLPKEVPKPEYHRFEVYGLVFGSYLFLHCLGAEVPALSLRWYTKGVEGFRLRGPG